MASVKLSINPFPLIYQIAQTIEICFHTYIYSRIYENRNIGHQEPTHLKLTQLK